MAEEKPASAARWFVLAAVVLLFLAIFVVRTILARTGNPPRLFELFDTLTVAGAALVLARDFRRLTRREWLVGLGLGLFVGVQLPFATLFHPYPFLDLVRQDWSQALLRGAFITVAAWGGLVIAHEAGPVQLRLARGAWQKALVSFAAGAAVGVPLALLNAFANGWVQGRPFAWQSPFAAAMDALQPALVEEVIYRLALLGLLWLLLRRYWPGHQAVRLAAALALLVHTYAHFGDAFVTQPLPALLQGAILGLLWGVPPTVLALRRDLEAATGFHWVQDFARFWAGF
jgi:hypothetical protein